MRQEDKKSILNIIDNRWWSGSSHFAVYTTKALHENGYDTAIIGDPDTPAIQRATELGLQVLGGFNPRTTNALKYYSDRSKLLSVIEKGNYRILIAHGPPSHFWASRMKKLLGDKITLIRGLSENMDPKVNLVSKNIYRKHTDHFFASSSSLIKKYSRAFDISEKKFTLSLGPFDLDEFDNSYEPKELDDEEITFGLIARLSPVKGHEIYIKAAAIALEKNPSLKFLISGDEQQISKRELNAIAENAGISDRVTISGSFSHPSEPISMIHVGVIASTFSEVICRVGMEYMAAGKPVITSDVNVLPELVQDGVTGLIVPSGDIKALSDAILRLSGSRDLIKKLGENGRKRAEMDFRLNKFAETIEPSLKQTDFNSLNINYLP